MNHAVCPKDYRQIETLDFVRNRRQMKIVAIAALAVVAAMVGIGLAIRPAGESLAFIKTHLWTIPLMAAMYAAYIILHELTHGVLMHALSGVKPKYGFSLCYAYAGSRAYFDRFSHNLIALAPLTLWGAALAVLERTLPNHWFWIVYIIQISNVSGSVGDVYCVLHMSRLPKDILIQDTGTRMRILAPRSTNEEQK